MNRLFSHSIFVALVLSTIGAGVVPSLVERWTQGHEEAVQEQTQQTLEQMRGGAHFPNVGAPSRHRSLLPGIAMLLVVSGLCAVWWLIGARRDGRLRRRSLTRWVL